MIAAPQVDPNDLHQTAWQVVAVMHELAAHPGLLSTSEIAERCELDRNTARRILRTLEALGWVRREAATTADLWMVGAELPRIGVQFQERLIRAAAARAGEWERLNTPFVPTPRSPR